MTRAFAQLCVLSTIMLVAACTRVEPYVYDPETINRLDANFGKELKTRGAVTICYNKYKTKPQEVVDLAVAECGRFGGTALFSRSTYAICPLIAPYAATYTCWQPSQAKPEPEAGADVENETKSIEEDGRGTGTAFGVQSKPQ